MTLSSWDECIKAFPLVHVLQSQEWGDLKTNFGWKSNRVMWVKNGNIYRFGVYPKDFSNEVVPIAAAQILVRSISIGGFSARLRVVYVPKGPLLDWNNKDLRTQVLDDLWKFAKQQGAIFIKIDPDIIVGTGIPQSPQSTENPDGKEIIEFFQHRGFQFSEEQVQFRNTVVVDLSATEDQLLASMKQKTRYNIRLAERKGIKIRTGSKSDLPLLYQMYAETSIRDQFVIRSVEYYQRTWSKFIDAGIAMPWIAEFNEEPIAAIIVFQFAKKSWYFYGMSRDQHREKMPNYLLQWEAIKHAKNTGCREYDLWGAPDQFIEGDPLWNVYRFKEGLGGRVIRHIGAWDLPVKPLVYKIYSQVLPRIMNQMRTRGKKQTNQSITGL